MEIKREGERKKMAGILRDRALEREKKRVYLSDIPSVFRFRANVLSLYPSLSFRSTRNRSWP